MCRPPAFTACQALVKKICFGQTTVEITSTRLI